MSVFSTFFNNYAITPQSERDIARDRHILKKDPKKWGTGDPLKLSSFFAKIVFLVLLYKTVSKIFFKSTNFGYF